jgi:cellulose synthase/poly-beta-1,6-N-acetylglucosamine synthase-like glycosyltransferase
MKLALYGILIILALFIVLMVFNPNLSCFGRKLKSPLYPILRKKKKKQKRMKTVDYGFDLGNPGEKRIQGSISQKKAQQRRLATKHNIATEDYGFDLGGGHKEEKQ